MRRLIRTFGLLFLVLACLGLPADEVDARRKMSSSDGESPQRVLDVRPGSLPGLRIYVRERGMHRLTYEALVSAGVPLDGVDRASLALWWRDQLISFDLVGRDDGVFGPGDALVFYGEPYTGRYMTRNIYRLTWVGAGGSRMATRDGAPQPGSVSTLVMHPRVRVEFNRVYYSAHRDLPRDADHLFDNPLYPNSVVPTATTTYTLDLPNLVHGSATLRAAVHGGRSIPGRDPDHSILVRLNGVDLGLHQWDGNIGQVVDKTVPASLLRAGDNKLALQAALRQLPGIDYYWVSPDWVEITYPAIARATNDQLYIPASPSPSFHHRIYLPATMDGAAGSSPNPRPPADSFNLTTHCFANGGIRVYDVSDPGTPVLLTGARETFTARVCPSFSYAVEFAAEPSAAYMIASRGGFLSPASMEYDAGSDLASPSNDADYIAIVHRSLWDAIQPLLDHRSAEGMRVAKIDVQDIYDEFGGGMVDPEAIRSFLSHAYHNWNAGEAPPQYVLLVGDGHYDFRGELRPGLPNLVPPYLLSVDPTIGETAADNRYASVDGDADFLPDIALGRIPARNPAEVTALVHKILAYERSAPAGDWQRRAVFVADRQDDPDGNFHALSDQAALILPSSYLTTTVYSASNSAFEMPAGMKAAILGAFDGQALYLQWFGHAARASWSNDRLWALGDPVTLAPNASWPFVAHFSCWSGYFINVLPSSQYGNNEQSLAEAMLLAPGKGSLADFSPTGLHLGASLAGLNRALMEAIFVERIDRVGKATDAARLTYFHRGAGPLDLVDTQALLGDPATRLKLP